MTEWPKIIRLLAWFRTPADTGVGDTIAHNLNRIPAFKGMGASDAFIVVMTNLGISCGCADRRKNLNERYPYT